jgi:hypothetical protein
MFEARRRRLRRNIEAPPPHEATMVHIVNLLVLLGEALLKAVGQQLAAQIIAFVKAVLDWLFQGPPWL